MPITSVRRTCESYPICDDKITENDRCVIKLIGIHCWSILDMYFTYPDKVYTLNRNYILMMFIYIHSTNVMKISTRFDICYSGKVKSGEGYRNRVASFAKKSLYENSKSLLVL